MRPSQAIASSLHFLVVFAFFATAGFFFALPFLPEVRLRLAEWVLNQTTPFSPLAIGVFLLALLLLAGFYGVNRGKKFCIHMGSHLTSIENKVLQESIVECLKRHFPDQISVSDIAILRGRKLEITATLTAEPRILPHIEEALKILLKERFGYVKPFYLVLKSTAKESQRLSE